MWQSDTFQFRIRGIGKVYVTGFTDDCSRYRVKSKVYLHKDTAFSDQRSSLGPPRRTIPA